MNKAYLRDLFNYKKNTLHVNEENIVLLKLFG